MEKFCIFVSEYADNLIVQYEDASEQKKIAEMEKEAAEIFYTDSNPVFCSSLGTPIDPRNLIRNFHLICKKNSMRRVSVHSLTHSYTNDKSRNRLRLLHFLGCGRRI